MTNNDVLVVRLTEQELQDIQLTLADKMMDLYRNRWNQPEELITEKIQQLNKVVEKCSSPLLERINTIQ